MSDRQEGPGWWLASDGKWYPPESHPNALSAQRPRPGMEYGGFWLRVWSVLIDSVIIFTVSGLLGALFGGDDFFSSREAFGSGDLVSLIGGWLYFTLMETSKYQATLGKQALGLKVTDVMGNPLTFGRASGRHFGKILSTITFLIGFLMAGFTPRKQALHDLMAGTLVVRVLRRPGSCL